jgi:threonyl-tRNA synthetase
MGSDEVWDRAEGALIDALKSLNLPYVLNAGDGAFYGPKLDIMFVDAINRPWQLGTLQVDFNMPQAFDLKYIGEDNKDHKPVMLHRAVLGSLERFIGVYLEHTAGHFPLWLSPVQVSLLTVTDRQHEMAQRLEAQFKAAGLRVHADYRGEKLGYKIREAQLQKTPYMIILGDKELESGRISVRLNKGTVIESLAVEEFMLKVLSEIKERKLESVFLTAPTSTNQEAKHSSI